MARVGRCRWLAYGAIVLPILLVAGPRTNTFPPAELTAMIRGTAKRPYVYRQLVPVVTRLVDAGLPLAFRGWISAKVARSEALVQRWRWNPDRASWFMIVFFLHGASLLLFAGTFERLVLAWIPMREEGAVLATVGALALIPIHFGYSNFIYDFPGLALYSLALLWLRERRFLRYFLLLPLVALNKETVCLLLPVFILQEWSTTGTAKRIFRVGLHVVIIGLVLVILRTVYRENPGGGVEIWLKRNLAYRPGIRGVINDLNYWVPVLGAFVGAGSEARQLRTYAILSYGILLPLTAVFGFFGEWRALYEAYPFVALMLVSAAMRLPFIGRRLACSGSPGS